MEISSAIIFFIEFYWVYAGVWRAKPGCIILVGIIPVNRIDNLLEYRKSLDWFYNLSLSSTCMERWRTQNLFPPACNSCTNSDGINLKYVWYFYGAKWIPFWLRLSSNIIYIHTWFLFRWQHHWTPLSVSFCNLAQQCSHGMEIKVPLSSSN